MLRYKTELDLVQSPCTTSGQETERVYSYNPGTRPHGATRLLTDTRNQRQRFLVTAMRYLTYCDCFAVNWLHGLRHGDEHPALFRSVHGISSPLSYRHILPTPPHLRRVRITSIRKNWTEIEGNTWHGAPEKVPLKSRGQDVPQGAQTVKMLNYVYFFTHVRPVTRVIPVAAKTLMPAFSLLSLHRTIR